jgi:hypothetical protein
MGTDPWAKPLNWLITIIHARSRISAIVSSLHVAEFCGFGVFAGHLRTRAAETIDREASFMNERQTYRCDSCNCEAKFIRSSADDRTNPRCKCGAQMKKFYSKPAVRRMSAEIETIAVAKTNRN